MSRMTRLLMPALAAAVGTQAAPIWHLAADAWPTANPRNDRAAARQRAAAKRKARRG